MIRERPNIGRFGSLVGDSPKMTQVYDLVEKAAQVNVPVLILGESGTGKELVSREIHQRGVRRSGPFVPVNTGALSAELVASELFGHVKGAFTGAGEDYEGRFTEANRGTLFLDEVTTMAERVQVVFLRVLEEGVFRPIGAKHDRQVDVRVIAATNTDLREAVEAGRFREDLLQRLTVFRIILPPLREHLQDLPMLAFHFLEQVAKEFSLDVDGVSDRALEILSEYPWPGNIRELRNTIAQSAIVAGHGALLPNHIPLRITAHLDHVRGHEPVAVYDPSGPESIPAPRVAANEQWTRNATLDPVKEALTLPLGLPLAEVRKAYVLRTLADCSYNKVRASRILGVSRKTLHGWLAIWGIVQKGT